MDNRTLNNEMNGEKINLNNIFEHKVYKICASLGLLLLIFLSTNIYLTVQRIPIVENNINILIEKDKRFLIDFKNLENFVHNNDRRILILENRND